MKIKNAGSMINVTLDMSFDDAVKVQKYAPEAMILTDEDKNQLFRACVRTCCGNTGGQVNNCSAEFIKEREKPAIWFNIGDIPKEEVEAYILEHFGMPLAKVKKVEKQMLEALEKVDAEVGSIKDAIGIL